VNLLLDTNALLWSLVDSDRLGVAARLLITEPRNVVYVSAASAWEIAIKTSLGKLSAPDTGAAWLPEALRASRFTPLSITIEHALGVERLPKHHADPFDRLLLAQAIAEQLTIVTSDRRLEAYGVPLVLC
jgi:PIN domain nuclease of toxin-antitoxin system